MGKCLNRAKFVFEIRIQAKFVKIIATPNYASSKCTQLEKCFLTNIG
jgi:hypothetical protein